MFCLFFFCFQTRSDLFKQRMIVSSFCLCDWDEEIMTSSLFSPFAVLKSLFKKRENMHWQAHNERTKKAQRMRMQWKNGPMASALRGLVYILFKKWNRRPLPESSPLFLLLTQLFGRNMSRDVKMYLPRTHTHTQKAKISCSCRTFTRQRAQTNLNWQMWGECEETQNTQNMYSPQSSESLKPPEVADSGNI